jgi:DNA-binding GntR family transcriptional regulator
MAIHQATLEDLPAKSNSLSERIYVELRRKLQYGLIGLRDRLVDIEIAAAYGTSRMPAREALLRLVNEGYLVGTSRGFVIPRLSLNDIADIFEVRKLLEPRAAANAARDLDAAALDRLGNALERARSAQRDDNPDQLSLAVMAFRTAWLNAVKNVRLANTIARFIDHVQTVRLETMNDPTVRQTVVQGLEGLYEAFSHRDPIAVADRMIAFMGAAEQTYFAACKRAADRAQTVARANSGL